MQVREAMTAEVRTCRAEEPLLQAIGRLAASGGSSFVVVASDEKPEPVGMLTLRDVVGALCRESEPFEELAVSNVMSRALHGCRLDDRLWEVAELMETHAVRHLPVLDPDGHVAGMISLTDLARVATSDEPGACEALSPLAVCRLLLSAHERG